MMFYIDLLTSIDYETWTHIKSIESHHPGELILLINSEDYVLTRIYGLPSTKSHCDQRSSPKSDWTIQLSLDGKIVPFVEASISLLQTHEVTDPLLYVDLVSYIFRLYPKTLCSNLIQLCIQISTTRLSANHIKIPQQHALYSSK